MEDAVHVVWHDHELIQPHMCEVAGNSQPEVPRDQSRRVQANYARPDIAKPWRPSLGTDRHEIRTGLTIVMTGQPDGSTADPAPKKPVGIGLSHGRDDTTTPVRPRTQTYACVPISLPTMVPGYGIAVPPQSGWHRRVVITHPPAAAAAPARNGSAVHVPCPAPARPRSRGARSRARPPRRAPVAGRGRAPQ